MNDEFEPIDKLDEICTLLDELKLKYTVHYHDDGEFSFLKDGEASIEVPNPYTERTMFIDLQEEFSLFFGEEWHDHYYPEEDGFHDLCETIKGIINNEMCSCAVFCGEDLKWGGSWLSVKGNYARELASGYSIGTISGDVRDFLNVLSNDENYSELRIKFWNSKYDHIITAKKGS